MARSISLALAAAWYSKCPFTTAKELIPVLVKIIGLIIPSAAIIERAASSISRSLNSERERSQVIVLTSTKEVNKVIMLLLLLVLLLLVV